MKANSLDEQARIMSNVIPIVSSSPPPLDDDANFNWDEDDDEYGNFTSAPTVSTTTIASDSSFEVHWSNSETSLPANDGISKGSHIKSGSRAYPKSDNLNSADIDRKRSDNIPVDKQNSVTESSSRAHDSDSEGAADNENFQDSVHFDRTEFSKSPSEASNGVTENKHGSYQDLSLSLKQNSADDSVVTADEDEFQDFAHFNNNVVSESRQHSEVDKPDLSQEENKTCSNNILTISSPSSKESPSSSPDQCSEAAATDSESAGSFHLKNTDSIYSSASTVDSGVFSADLSPGSHQGEITDICLNVDKEGRLRHNYDILLKDNMPTSSSLSAGTSLEDAELFEASKEHCDNTLLSVSDKYRTQSNLNSSEGCASSNEGEDHIENLSVKEEPEAGADKSHENYQHFTLVQRMKASSCSISPTHDTSDTINTKTSANSLEFSNVIEQTLEDQNSLSASGCGTAVDHDVGSVIKGMSSGGTSHPEDDLRATECNGDNDITVIYEDGGKCNIETFEPNEDGETSDLDNVRSDEYGDNQSDVCCDIASKAGELTEVHTQELVTSGSDCTAVNFNSEEVNSESVLQTTGTNSSEYSKPHEDNENVVEEVVEDLEFGDFSFIKGQTVDDSQEVPPITFRTSICEASDETDDDDEFTFSRERSLALNDESDEFGAFGTAAKEISDSVNNDDFGEFDSAANFQPNSSVTCLNKKDEDDDEFGDFGKSEPAGEDAGWADFGTAPATSAGFDNSSFTKSQDSVPASLVKNKVQTLREAVRSCFPESPEQPQKDRIMLDGSEQYSPNSDHSMNPSKEDEGPLPLDTVVDLGLSNALEAKQQTWAVVQHPAKKDPKVRLWTHLKDVDSCHALMYGWHASHCSKEVYASLHIDTQNILFTQKKQAVPFFASGLGILEPIRGGGGGGGTLERKKEKSIIPATVTTLLDISKTDYQQTSTPQDIPPVDFDWSSSGLTNPLTVFKTENQESSPSALQPLEEILRKTTPTAKLATNEVLSPEASRVLQKMPDLSFMLSRVLMFPVKQ